MLANKQDLPGAASEEQIADALGLREMSGDRHWRIAPCSAVTGDGLLGAVDWLVSDIGSRIYLFD